MPFHGPSPQRRNHRLPTEIYACTGYEFFFTICARERGEPFRDEKLAQEVCDSLIWTARKYAWQLFGFCLMPDHFHFACSLTQANTKQVNAGGRGTVTEGLLDHVARFKSFTTSKAWAHGIKGQLWQKSSYDRVLDMPWAFEDILRYVLENPVRRGLVERWEDWPYSRIVDPW
ncbi:MAG: hypothetical protein K2X38_14745 [Gemmataceae bacterium]|nr:hypothetical protein [Gemmataceae bacterium]